MFFKSNRVYMSLYIHR